MLASQGYDVWLGNNRGNRNSPIEVEEKDKYWSYNFDHLVEYDFPTFIDGILKETQK
jgi:lysosomal acid lipase/cholesteryl ester hydrolase